MTFSNDFINARIADVMLESNRRPKPDYIRNPKDGQRFLDATQSLLTQEQLEPEAGSMESSMLESMGPVLYRVTMIGLINQNLYTVFTYLNHSTAYGKILKMIFAMAFFIANSHHSSFSYSYKWLMVRKD